MSFSPLAVLDVARCAWSPSTVEAARLDRPAEPRPWRTYQWAYRDSSGGMTPLLELRIRECLERHLLASGMQRADPPQLTIGFFLEQPSGSAGPRAAVGGVARPRPACDGGLLVVDICEARTFRTVWRGAASRLIRPHGASRAEIEDAVSSVAQELPWADGDRTARRLGVPRYALS